MRVGPHCQLQMCIATSQPSPCKRQMKTVSQRQRKTPSRYFPCLLNISFNNTLHSTLSNLDKPSGNVGFGIFDTHHGEEPGQDDSALCLCDNHVYLSLQVRCSCTLDVYLSLQVRCSCTLAQKLSQLQPRRQMQCCVFASISVYFLAGLLPLVTWQWQVVNARVFLYINNIVFVLVFFSFTLRG